MTTPVTDKANFVDLWWDRVRAGERLVQKCHDCGVLQLHPRRRCNSCASASLSLQQVSGNATLYTFSEILRNAPSDFQDQLPYILAVVSLTEGPRMLTRVIKAEASELRCDMRLRWVLADVGGKALPCFEPAESAASSG